MALVFVSYKRGTEGVDDILAEFKKRGFAIWFDKWSIKVGDMDWQASIDKGIRDADIFILCLNKAACDSPYIRNEVQQALSKQERRRRANEKYKFFFPVLLGDLGSGDELTQNLSKLGLPERPQWLNLTPNDPAKEPIDKLFDVLAESGYDPSVHADRTGDLATADLHRRYWLHMSAKFGRFDLRPLAPREDKRFDRDAVVDDIYVPIPTDLRLIHDIHDYDIEQSWIVRDGTLTAGIDYDRRPSEEMRQHYRQQTEALRRTTDADLWDDSGLDAHVQNCRIALDDEKQDQEFRRFGRLDEATETVTLMLEEAASIVRRMLLVGDSGSGKTTFIRHFIASIAQDLWLPVEERPAASRLSWWIQRDLNVAYVDMGPLAAYLTEHKQEWNVNGLLNYIEYDLRTAGLAGYAPILRREFDAGTAMLIIDDIHDVLTGSGPVIRQAIDNLSNLLHTIDIAFPNLRLMLTVRTRAAELWQPNRMIKVSIQNWDKTLQLRALDRYFNTFMPAAKRELELLKATLDQYDSSLTGNPRFIALMAVLHQKQLGDLYRRIFSVLLENEQDLLNDAFDHPTEKPKDLALVLLSQFAYESIQDHPTSQPPGRRLERDLNGHIHEFANDHGMNSDTISLYLREHSGLFIGVGETFRFTHNDFRIYLAAEYVVKSNYARDDRRGELLPLRQLIEEEPHIWSQVFRVVGGILPSFTDLLDFMEDLVDSDPPKTLDPQTRQAHSVWLAGRLAFDLRIEEQLVEDRHAERPLLRAREVRDAQATLDRLREWLRLIVETRGTPRQVESRGSVDLVRRAEIGRLLGRLGDERPGVGVDPDTALPDISWVEIAASDDQPSFYVAKYPVTVAQYLAFVSADDCADPDFWTEGGRGGFNPDNIRECLSDSVMYPGNHPVTDVTWYEANAFCRWLTRRLGGGRVVSLPTRAQWVRAARKDTQWVYPYEGGYDPYKANGRLTGIGRATAVGLLPEGDSPYGISDLSGNVYEWSADHDDVKPEPRRALVGGSWKSYPGFMRIDACYFDYPENSSDYWGFRVVCE